MANYSFIGYDPGSIVFSGSTVSVSGTYDPAVDRRIFDVTDGEGGSITGGGADDGTTFDGDRFRNEAGDDLTQTGVVTNLDGSTVFATGNIYLEQSYTLTKPGGGTIEMYLVEVDGTPVGYIITEPLEGGVSYPWTTTNVTPTNAPDATDPLVLENVPCFANGTFVQTDRAEVAVEDLQVGDLVQTAANGLQPILWIGRTRVPKEILAVLPNLRPIKIEKSSLGQGLPVRDLFVSRQHRMVVVSKIAERMFDTSTVFVAANKLVGLPGITTAHAVTDVTYYHILLDNHAVIFAEGTPTESLYTGAQGLAALGPTARAQLARMIPDLNTDGYAPVPALPLLTGKEQKALVDRHRRNIQPLLQMYLPATFMKDASFV